MNLSLSNIGVLEDSFNWWHALAELWKAKFFKLGSRDGCVEIFTVSKGLAVNFRLMSRREDSLRLFTLGSQPSHCSCVSLDVNASLLLELSHAVVDEDVVEVFTS